MPLRFPACFSRPPRDQPTTAMTIARAEGMTRDADDPPSRRSRRIAEDRRVATSGQTLVRSPALEPRPTSVGRCARRAPARHTAEQNPCPRRRTTNGRAHPSQNAIGVGSVPPILRITACAGRRRPSPRSTCQTVPKCLRASHRHGSAFNECARATSVRVRTMRLSSSSCRKPRLLSSAPATRSPCQMSLNGTLERCAASTLRASLTICSHSVK